MRLLEISNTPEINRKLANTFTLRQFLKSLLGKTEHYLQLLFDPGDDGGGGGGQVMGETCRFHSTFWQSGDARSHSPS